jgi:predicted ribosomally synthesized peptide with SipW-like signal peptide
MNKNILKSVLMIGAVLAVVTGATMAYFSQRITAEGNTFSAGTMTMTLNGGQSGPILGPALKAQNFYPGAFTESASIIENNYGSGAIAFNPEISLANASDPNGMADYLWLEVWTNGKLWYKDRIKNFPGYTGGKLVLDTIQPGEQQVVAFRLLMVETAPDSLQGKIYSVNVAITAHQWNDSSYPVSTPVDISSGKYVANTWSYSVCGVRQPNYYPAVGADGSGPAYDTTKYSPYFSYSVQGASPWGWSAKGPLPQTYQGGTTETDFSCTVK